jgi:flagellar basal body P-ring formation protein FlgA
MNGNSHHWMGPGKMNVHILGKWLVVLIGMALALPAAAQQKFENLDRVDGLVATTVGANIGQPGGAVAPVDRRLRLAACPGMPDVSGPMFGAAIVECKALGWRIRVPLAAGGNNAPMTVASQVARPTARPARSSQPGHPCGRQSRGKAARLSSAGVTRLR